MKEKLYRFMMGRYGNDTLNYVLLGTYLVLSFMRNSIASIIGLILFMFSLYRCFSRDIWKRRSENEKFLQLTKPIRQHIKAITNNFKDKQRKYFVCPSCQQVVRVPRHRGKIEITCPSCRKHFTRKS